MCEAKANITGHSLCADKYFQAFSKFERFQNKMKTIRIDCYKFGNIL